MPRPRLTAADYQARLDAYCSRYGVEATSRGIPPFPTGNRETPQHREWISLHRLHDRISRRTRGQCQACSEPAVEGELFCAKHGRVSAPAEEQKRLHRAQRGACPICEKPLALEEARAHRRSALLHPDCLRLVRLVESLGPATLARARRYTSQGEA
jgi:hypothetical protein